MLLIRHLFSARLALLRLILGAVLISFSGVFVLLVEVGPVASAFWRTMLGGLMLLVWLLYKRHKLVPGWRSVFWLAIGGFMFAVDLFAWHKSIFFIGVGLSTLLANFQVFVMAAAAVLLFGERMTRIQVLAIPLAVFGLYLIVGHDWSTLDSNSRAGVYFGLITAVAYASYMLCLRQARWAAPYRDAAADLCVASFFSAFFLYFMAQYSAEAISITRLSDFAWLSAYALIGQVLGWLFISSSLPYVPTVHIGLALLLQPTLSYLWGVLIFNRSVSAMEVVGAGIAIFAIFLGSRSAPPPASSESAKS
ncbi:MAG: DMT family transporter [Gammaproteobacteria bacterium]